MSWLDGDDRGLDLHGGPHYRGHCPICGCSTGCHDAICDECEEIEAEETTTCPQCDMPVTMDEFNKNHGLCVYCVEQNAKRFTQKFLRRVNTIYP